MDSSLTKNTSRQDDEYSNLIQKKRYHEVKDWFQAHFVNSSQQEYINRCSLLLLQGPSGCGKSTTLKWIADELNIPVREYSDTTDTTAINHDIAHTREEDDRSNLSLSILRKKALKFEYFVINSLRYNTLYQNLAPAHTSEDSEFESDDDGVCIVKSQKVGPPQTSGVIIHVETPLTFSRCNKILIQTLNRIQKNIKELSKVLLRRIAIVFESLEGECETIPLSTKVKQSLNIQIFKFNPITRTNMKKFVEQVIKNYNYVLDKEAVEQLVNDSDGNLGACFNTLRLVCEGKGTNIRKTYRPHNCNSHLIVDCNPVSKKQKLYHDKGVHISLDASLMRDTTRSYGFFHILGKIFYQKRLYPECSNRNYSATQATSSSLVRPYQTENSTEDIVDMLGSDARNLTAWLHHHYHKFCADYNIEKASILMENLATTDTISMSSTQSSQFYESHSALDQIQTYLAIDSVVFSLYKDQLQLHKPSHKKMQTEQGVRIVKSSIEVQPHGGNNELYSFNKPTTINLHKLVEDYQNLLDCCFTKLVEVSSIRSNPLDFVLDYLPYLNRMATLSSGRSQTSTAEPCKSVSCHPIYSETSIKEVMRLLEEFDEKQVADIDNRHERLIELIENIEEKKKLNAI